ncbi:MAG: efflux transporter periplasmic adaptor subunit, partial [Cupriavidus necator]
MQRSRGCSAWVPVTLAIGMSMLAGCGGKKEAAAPPPPQVSVVTLKTEQLTLDTELPGRTTAFRIA